MNPRLDAVVTAVTAIPLLAYLGFALGDISFSTTINLVLAASIGIAALAGSLAIHNELEKSCRSATLTFGTLCLVIAFSFFVLMVVVQQAISIALNEASANEHGLRETGAYKAVSTGLNYMQLGMDVTFDIFYSLGMGVVSWVMLRVPGATRFIGMYGILAAMSLAAFNLATFPLPPSRAGLFDVGPFTAAWWVAIIVVGAVEETKRGRVSAGDT